MPVFVADHRMWSNEDAMPTIGVFDQKTVHHGAAMCRNKRGSVVVAMIGLGTGKGHRGERLAYRRALPSAKHLLIYGVDTFGDHPSC